MSLRPHPVSWTNSGRAKLRFCLRQGTRCQSVLPRVREKIGIRLCGHPVAAVLAKAVGGPLTGTSANLAGHPGCSNPPDLEPEIADKLELILDAGPLRGGVGSTVVDITGSSPKVLREGVVPANSIIKTAEEC